MKDRIDELQIRYNELLQRARPVDAVYTFQTARSDDGAPHVEISDEGIDLVVTERGLELSRRRFTSDEDFLFTMISDVTFWIGVDYEFKNRIEDQDCRRIIFAKQLEMIGRISPDWATRREHEITAILAENPMMDK